MENLSLPIKLLLAIVLGGLIGLERESATKEMNKEKGFGGDKWGLRTYSLISLLGAIAGLLFLFGNQQLSIIITISFFIFMFLYYAIGGWMIKSMGLTTELGAVFSFLIGYFVTSEIIPLQLVIAITVVIDLILSMKEKSRIFMVGLKRSDIDAFIGFAIIALVVLPFLPNKAIHLTDITATRNLLQAYGANMSFFETLEILNPFRLWFIVALITGIDVLGYILTNLTGNKKSIILTSAVGGFVSSTSVTQSLAIKSKTGSNTNELVTAAVIANLTSFIQLFILIAPLNSAWLVNITSVLFVIIAASILCAVILHLKDRGKMVTISDAEELGKNEDIKEEKIFSLMPALRFALVLVLVRIITKSALILFGESGFLVSSIAASFSGLDAVVINLAELAGKAIDYRYALLTLLAVNAFNLFGKAVYAYFSASRQFSSRFFMAALFIVLASFAGYFFIF